MKVYMEVQETVWNKYEVLGVESEEELKSLMEYYGHNNLWSYDEGLIMEYKETLEFIETDYDTMEVYEE